MENLDIKNRVWVSDLDFDSLVKDAKNVEDKFEEVESDVTFKEFSKYEVSKRDIAILVDKKVDAEVLSCFGLVTAKATVDGHPETK